MGGFQVVLVGEGSFYEINQQFRDNCRQFSAKLLQSGGSEGVYNGPIRGSVRQPSYIKCADW